MKENNWKRFSRGQRLRLCQSTLQVWNYFLLLVWVTESFVRWLSLVIFTKLMTGLTNEKWSSEVILDNQNGVNVQAPGSALNCRERVVWALRNQSTFHQNLWLLPLEAFSCKAEICGSSCLPVTRSERAFRDGSITAGNSLVGSAPLQTVPADGHSRSSTERLLFTIRAAANHGSESSDDFICFTTQRDEEIRWGDTGMHIVSYFTATLVFCRTQRNVQCVCAEGGGGELAVIRQRLLFALKSSLLSIIPIRTEAACPLVYILLSNQLPEHWTFRPLV